MKLRYGLKIGDLALVAFLLLLALLLFLLPLLSQKGTEAEILIGETGEVRVVSLGTEGDYEIATAGLSLTVRVKDGAVSVSRSDCRDGICVRTPAISRPGQSIVCAPAGVVVRIPGEEVLVDGVSG